jgi:hypothetical protein
MQIVALQQTHSNEGIGFGFIDRNVAIFSIPDNLSRIDLKGYFATIAQCALIDPRPRQI